MLDKITTHFSVGVWPQS